MPWPVDELERRFGRPGNEAVLRHLKEKSPSAHSDLGSLLLEEVKRLPGAGFFGPNPTACSYVFAHTEGGVIFALAVGMTSLLLRLNEAPETEPFPELGPGWRALDPFAATRTQAENARLARKLIAAAFRAAQ